MSGRRVVFVDRDGTLVEEPPDQQVDSLEKIRLRPRVVGGGGGKARPGGPTGIV
jgi:histidinol phosphatase-like enzyme